MANQIAYGFIGQEHLFAQRVSSTNIQVVRDAIDETVAFHNAQTNAILAELTAPVASPQIRYKTMSVGTLQPLDEWGVPVPERHGAYYDIGFPIQGGGTAWGDNRVTRAQMTVQEVNDNVVRATLGDADWLKRHILAAGFDNVAWTFDDPEHGNLTVQPLANGDAVTYRKINGSVATDNHYLAQAATVADATNPFPTIFTELTEHPQNRGAEIVAYIPSNLVAATQGLATFYAVTDPALTLGISATRLSGSTGVGMGTEVLGRADKVWIVEMSELPDNYIFAVARGGDPALGMRQYDVPALQGFFTENHSPDGNVNEYRFIRYAGFGGYNRVGAVVYRCGNATYAIPSGYAAPLPV